MRPVAPAELQSPSAAFGTPGAQYAHARKFKRMRRALRASRSRVGRVQRDIERQLHRAPPGAGNDSMELLGRTRCILRHRPKDKKKLYRGMDRKSNALAGLDDLPFSSRFRQIIQSEKWIFLATFFCSVVSLTLFTAPAVEHRMMRPLRNRIKFKHLASRQMLIGAAALSASLV